MMLSPPLKGLLSGHKPEGAINKKKKVKKPHKVLGVKCKIRQIDI